MSAGARAGSTPGRERVLLGLFLLFLGAALVAIAARRPLWYDELFSWYVAQQDGATGVLRALLAGADNGPPIDYWLRQLSVVLFGDSALAFRAPSIIAYLAGLLCLWSFVRRRASAGAAWTAVLFPLATASLYYATEGRAYALLLFLQAFSLLAWQRAVDNRDSRRWPVALFLALAASPLAHYYGVLNYLPVLAGELVRRAQRGAWSKRVALSVGLSFLTVILLPPFARNALEMRDAFWASSFGLSTPFSSYQFLLGKLLVPFVALVALGWISRRFAKRSDPGPSRLALRGHELGAVAAQILLPFVVLALAMLATNAMTHRYAIASCFGFALLAAHSIAWIERQAPVLSRLLIAALFLWGATQVGAAIESAARPWATPELEAQLAALDGNVAVECPRLFLESYHHLPGELRAKLYYLSDRAEARRRTGYDNDEIAIEKLRPWVDLNNEAYEPFMLREREFFVLADARRCWLLARLVDDGVELRFVVRMGSLELFRATRSAADGTPRGS